MARTVSAVVTAAGECLGAVGPFAVGVPWWAEVGPVVERLERALGVPVLVLRLLSVEGGEGARDGHVTYHVEAGAGARGPWRPVAFAPDAHPLRLPWATVEGIRELLAWASGVAPLTGPMQQHKTWNLAALFRLTTARGPYWLKATPPFAADEATAIAAVSRVDAGLVPTVVAAEPGRLLIAEIPGEDCWEAPPEVIASALRRLVAAQAALVADAGPGGLPDRRTKVLAEQVVELLDGPAGAELTAAERAAAHRLTPRWQALDECGLPDTLVHGDFHPGNWRRDGGPPTVLDWADAHWGNPVLDGLRAIDFLPADRRDVARTAWTEAWNRHAPEADPARALEVAAPLAHLAYAVRYQEFLDGIEPSERIYHEGDPVAAIRAALRA